MQLLALVIFDVILVLRGCKARNWQSFWPRISVNHAWLLSNILIKQFKIGLFQLLFWWNYRGCFWRILTLTLKLFFYLKIYIFNQLFITILIDNTQMTDRILTLIDWDSSLDLSNLLILNSSEIIQSQHVFFLFVLYKMLLILAILGLNLQISQLSFYQLRIVQIFTKCWFLIRIKILKKSTIRTHLLKLLLYN